MVRAFKLTPLVIMIGCASLTACGGTSAHTASGAPVSGACKAATAQVLKDMGNQSNHYVVDVRTDVSTCTTMAALAGSGAPWYGIIADVCFADRTSTPGTFNNAGPVDPEDSQEPGCQSILRRFRALGGQVNLSNGLANSSSDPNFVPIFLRLTKLFGSEGGTQTTSS
jgi:hypothetical protein